MTTATGTRDTTYDVVSVLYHALQEAETLQGYIEDARGSGDEQSVRFFEEVQEQDRNRVEQAKDLLRAKLSR